MEIDALLTHITKAYEKPQTTQIAKAFDQTLQGKCNLGTLTQQELLLAIQADSK
jgi:hypothetical protein